MIKVVQGAQFILAFTLLFLIETCGVVLLIQYLKHKDVVGVIKYILFGNHL